MNRAAAGLILLLLAAPPPQARFSRYERALNRTPENSGQACFALDAGIFAHAAPQLSDLRLYHDGAETPYLILTAAPAQSTDQPIAPLNLGRRGGQTAFDAEMPPGKFSDLRLSVTGHDFFATVNVAGSQSQSASAQTAIGSYSIFDFTGQKLGRSTVLHLPESDFRYLHFRIAGPLEPQAFTGLSVLSMPAGKARYVTVAESSHISQQGHSSLIEFTVPPHTPVDRIVFAPGAEPANFSRDVRVTVTPIPQKPATDAAEPPAPALAFGNLLRIHRAQNGHRIDEERLSLQPPNMLSESSAKWAVAVENGDDAPVPFASVSLEMEERDLCFEASGAAPYTLFYGDPILVAPRYDYAALFAPRPDAAQAWAGPEQPNPDFQPRPDSSPFTERHPAILWLALIGVVALLGGIALRSSKMIRPQAP